MRVSLERIKCFLIALFSVFALGGCGAKEPQIKQVFIPVKCNLKMPLRPAESSDFEAQKIAHRERMNETRSALSTARGAFGDF